jgi:hypothetical protein
MIEQLKALTENKIGFEIKTRGDCQKLSELIAITIDQDISYNTLRRFFGLDKQTRPQKKTLDLLAKLNGYNSFVEFSYQYPMKFNWRLKEIAYDLINNEDPSELISFVRTINQITNETLDIIILILRELIIKKQISTIIKIFNLNALNSENYGYSELLHLGNSVGMLFRKYQIDYLNFSQTKHFTNTIFTTFVDYSSLNKNYGIYAQKVYITTKKSELKLFSGLLLQLKNFLNNKTSINNFESLISKKTHPILLSRYMSIKIMCEPNTKTFELLEKYKANFIKNHSIDYVYEMMMTSILTKNFILMDWIITNFKPEKITSKYYREWHFNILSIVKLFLDIHEKKNNHFDHLLLIEKFRARYSYESMYTIFVCILKYHLRIKPKLALKSYEALSRELNYKIFNKTYLTDYFKS